jgi:hypothetical protein
MGDGTLKHRTFTVLIEQDEDGYYVATVPALKSCYTQAMTLEDLYPRIKEVIELCLLPFSCFFNRRESCLRQIRLWRTQTSQSILFFCFSMKSLSLRSLRSLR